MTPLLQTLKKSVAFWSVLSVLAGAGGGYAILKHRSAPVGDDCCYPGSPCCHPGAPCCARNGHAARH